MDLRVELRGADVSRETIDTRDALDLFRAYLDLLARLAEEGGGELGFCGLRVDQGSAVLRANPTCEETAIEALEEAKPLLLGHKSGSATANQLAAKVIQFSRRFSTGDRRAVVGLRDVSYDLPTEKALHEMPPIATLSIRATVLRVGGTRPMVRLRAEAEERDFSLSCDTKTAQELGALLYQEIDIVASVARCGDGKILNGDLREYFKLDEGDVFDTWTKWYQDHGREFQSVETVDAELGRGEVDGFDD